MLIILCLLICFKAFPQDGKVVLINGGNEKNSNNLRYLENIRSMFSGFVDSGYVEDDISVLYGSGDFKDTNTGYGNPYGGSDFDIYGSPTPQVQSSNSEVPVENLDIRLTSEYVFSNKEKKLNGAAKKKNLISIFDKLSKELSKGEDLTLFITDHGSQESNSFSNSMGGFSAPSPNSETVVNLWGETLTIDEFNSLISVIPETSNVRIITNICFGGGLTKLTSSNVCVMANQVDEKPSSSESIDLDLYAQNFATAMKLKKDFDKDGKVTYFDAHQYATSLDNKNNRGKTSLDFFIEQNLRKINQKKGLGLVLNESIFKCVNVLPGVTTLEDAIDSFEEISTFLSPTSIGIPKNRMKYLNGRINKQLAALEGHPLKQKEEILREQTELLKKNLAKSAKEWSQLSETQKKILEKKSLLEAQELKNQITKFEAELLDIKALNQEIDFLKFASEEQMNEYKKIKNCMEGEYVHE